jgi:transcriptional regulator of arginine metabolism
MRAGPVAGPRSRCSLLARGLARAGVIPIARLSRVVLEKGMLRAGSGARRHPPRAFRVVPSSLGLPLTARCGVVYLYAVVVNIYSDSPGEAGRRRREILALVGQGGVRSQEELQRRLRRRGIAVAQPTLSRDLRTLGLAKTPTGYVTTPGGAYVPAEVRGGALDRAVGEFVLSVRAAASLVVVRTPPAGAHPLARALDEADLAEVVGTIAGDDTVFVATTGPAAARLVERRLRAPLAGARGERGRARA